MKRLHIAWIVGILVIIGLSIGSAIDWNVDSSDTGNDDDWVVAYDQEEVTHYASGWFHDYGSPITVGIANPNQFYNITQFNKGENEGVSFLYNGALVDRAGIYRINLEMSLLGGNNGDYEVALMKNLNQVAECSTFITTQAGISYNVAINCLVSLEKGDYLDVRVKDRNVPAQNIQYKQLNYNMFEVR